MTSRCGGKKGRKAEMGNVVGVGAGLDEQLGALEMARFCSCKERSPAICYDG